MIRAVLVVGWIGMVLLLWTAVTGYQVAGEDAAQQHLVLALFPSGALLFADLCLLIYLGGTLRLVRRTAAELALGAEWRAEQRRLSRGLVWWAAAAALALVVLFASGFPLYTQTWPAWVHHAGFALTAVLHAIVLLLAGPALRRGEARLAALGEAAAAAGAD